MPFNYDESWIGGVYYVKNLIAALNQLQPTEQPDIFILANERSSFEYLQTNSEYPRLHWIASTELAGIDRRKLSRRRRLTSFLLAPFARPTKMFDLVYPYPVNKSWRRTACWIPDFQDKRLPQFFSKDELEYRERQHRDYFTNYRHIVFSSKSAESDFQTFYPKADVNTHVLRFAVSERQSAVTSIVDVRKKYGLPERFFYAPNQFWIHKNHKRVIEAAALLKSRGVSVTIVFSGKEHDHRAPTYVEDLKKQAAEVGVADRVRFLGFLPRTDQMAVFHAAACIIQPSLFEGWSTVIEDAKSIGKFVLASSLDVNREQASENAEFFDPDSAEELASLIEKYANDDPVVTPINYDCCRLEFAEGFLGLIAKVAAESAAEQK